MRGDERDRTVDLLLAKYTYYRPEGLGARRRVFVRVGAFVVSPLVSRTSNVRPALVHMRTYRSVIDYLWRGTVSPMCTSVATSNWAFDFLRNALGELNKLVRS